MYKHNILYALLKDVYGTCSSQSQHYLVVKTLLHLPHTFWALETAGDAKFVAQQT